MRDPLKNKSSNLVCILGLPGLLGTMLNAAVVTHSIGPDTEYNGGIAANVPSVDAVTDLGNWDDQEFSFGSGKITVTSKELGGAVDGIAFTYQIKLTALGGTIDPYLSNSGNFLTFNDNGLNAEFNDTRGLRVEFINITESDADFDVTFAAINSFAMAETGGDATFTFNPNNGTNAAGGAYGFERFTDGKDTIWDDQNIPSPTNQTLVEWTEDASSIDIYGTSSPSANLRHLVYSFDTVPVPEPSSAALLGLGGLALILRRRR